MNETWHIRRARPDDRAALSRICLLTADNGADGTALYSDPDYPALIWAWPYLDFAPDFAFVLDTGEAAVGYIIAAPDTEGFETRLDAEWWPHLRARYGARTARTEHDRRVLELIAAPERSDPAGLADYPAHLHIDLLPVAQGRGWGRRLMAHLFAALREAGVGGVQLGVGGANARALGFYRRLGFSEIGRDGAIRMGQRL